MEKDQAALTYNKSKVNGINYATVADIFPAYLIDISCFIANKRHELSIMGFNPKEIDDIFHEAQQQWSRSADLDLEFGDFLKRIKEERFQNR